ncbi:hypothetical protein INR49_032776 [Caranx melampygus]|nr:hypothetical protein INR49_032776 [Caranx melampygus]
MAAAVLYTVILGAITVTGQQVVVQPKVYSSPGQTVNLSCVFTDATGVQISQVGWIYETEGRRINIAAFVPNNAPSYPESPLKDRVSFSPSPPVLTSPSIKIRDVKKTDEGNYICAFATLAGNIENISNLEMLEKIVDASVTPSTNQTVEGNSVNLTCEAAGSVFTRKWMKNGAELTESDNMMFYNESRVLIFLSLKKTDSGQYSCIISNPLSSVKVQHNMDVILTGQQVVVQPKVYSSPGQTVNLSCVFTDATGVLISQVTWLYETEGRRISIAAFVPNNAPSYPDSP